MYIFEPYESLRISVNNKITRKIGCIVIGAVIIPNASEERKFKCNISAVAEASGQKIHLRIMKVWPLSALPGCSEREPMLQQRNFSSFCNPAASLKQ